jgi:hypothetical protein
MNITWYHGKMWFYESDDVYTENGVQMALASDADGNEERIPIDIKTNGTCNKPKINTDVSCGVYDGIAYYLEGRILERQEEWGVYD